MTAFLSISVRFLNPYAHGRDESGDPEWPPSPLRMMQALIAASAGRWNERRNLRHASDAMRWLEALPHPHIVASIGTPSGVRCQFYVPDNTADMAVGAWERGDLTKQPKRTEKVVCPTHLDGETVYYLYPLASDDCPHLEVLSAAAQSITHLGWGVDIAVGDARVIADEEAAQLPGVRWHPASAGGLALRVPKPGTLDDLIRKHTEFLDRLAGGVFRPVASLREFEVARYRRQGDIVGRPWRAFELRDINGEVFRYPHRKLIHIAGMLRHLTIEAMKSRPPAEVAADWVETYVAGHHRSDSRNHRQLSYLPLPSIGNKHADMAIRRLMLAAPLGDDDLLDHIARQLAGQALKNDPRRPDPFNGGTPPILVPIAPRSSDGVVHCYTAPATIWYSVTPVILPGHDDHKAGKTKALIERALQQSGINQPCEFDWSPFSHFPKSYSAHKYDRKGERQGYFRPDHLESQTAVHLTLKFESDLRVPGPLVIGAGRHCGFGLMAHDRSTIVESAPRERPN